MKVYVASSWRCERQPLVVAVLRAVGHEVYDFRNPAPDDHGFSWSQVTPESLPWSAEKTREVLSHPVAEYGFGLDIGALRWCEVCVMVQPCGRSAALELGYAAGLGKRTIVFLADGQEPELMFKVADRVCVKIGEVMDFLNEKGR